MIWGDKCIWKNPIFVFKLCKYMQRKYVRDIYLYGFLWVGGIIAVLHLYVLLICILYVEFSEILNKVLTPFLSIDVFSC